MAARSAKTQTLSGEQIAKLQEQLANGGRPRVALSGPQFPDGSSGTVTRVGDPDLDGSDYITVRVKVNGISDELAFAPTELSIGRPAPRGAGRRASKPALRSAIVNSRSAIVNGAATPDQAVTATRGAATVPITASATPNLIDAVAAVPKRAVPKPAAPKPVTAPAAGQPSRRRKAGAPPKVSFTVTSSGATWTFSGTRGAKGVAKNVGVSPGVVTAIADLLDYPGLVEAVAEINETAWAEARSRADQLRAELSELEAVLATHLR